MHLKQHAHKKGRLDLPFVSGLLGPCYRPIEAVHSEERKAA